MTDPVESLTVIIEVAIALAGFSGIADVFGRRASGEWSMGISSFIDQAEVIIHARRNSIAL